MFRTENVMLFSFRNWKWEICQYILQKFKTTAKCPEWKVMHDRWNTIFVSAVSFHENICCRKPKTTCITLWGVKAIIPFIREVVLATEFAKKCPSLARFPSSFARKTGMPLLVSCAEGWLVMSDVLSKQGETFVSWSFCRVEQASSTISIS